MTLLLLKLCKDTVKQTIAYGERVFNSERFVSQGDVLTYYTKPTDTLQIVINGVRYDTPNVWDYEPTLLYSDKYYQIKTYFDGASRVVKLIAVMAEDQVSVETIDYECR